MHTTWKVANVRRHFTDSKRQKRHMTRDTWQTRWRTWYAYGTAYGTHMVELMVQHMVRIWYAYGTAYGTHMVRIWYSIWYSIWHAYVMHMVCISHAYSTHMVQHLVCHKHGTRYFHTSETWRSLSTGRAVEYTHYAHQEWSVFTHMRVQTFFVRFLSTHSPITVYLHIYLHIHFAHIFAHIFCTFTYLFRMLLYTCFASHVNVF